MYRATWPDEKIIRGTLSTIAAETARAGIGRQALILVGDAIGAHDCGQSLLYHGQFSHGYRNEKEDERFDGSCAFYAFTEKGVRKAAEDFPVPGESRHPFRRQDRGNEGVTRVPPEDFDPLLARQWNLFDAHVFVGATGIAVRKTASLLRDKATDPAVALLFRVRFPPHSPAFRPPGRRQPPGAQAGPHQRRGGRHHHRHGHAGNHRL